MYFSKKEYLKNKEVNIQDIIHEGSILIWNLAFPFLNSELREHIYRPFLEAANLLEIIQSNDY